MWDRCSEITLYILITPAHVWKSQHFFKGPNTMSRILMLADFRPHVTLFLSNFPHTLSGIACTDSFPCIICDFMLKSIHFWRETEIRVHKYNGWTFWKLGISLLSSYKTLWWYSKKKIFNTHNSYWRLLCPYPGGQGPLHLNEVHLEVKFHPEYQNIAFDEWLGVLINKLY